MKVISGCEDLLGCTIPARNNYTHIPVTKCDSRDFLKPRGYEKFPGLYSCIKLIGPTPRISHRSPE